MRCTALPPLPRRSASVPSIAGPSLRGGSKAACLISSTRPTKPGPPARRVGGRILVNWRARPRLVDRHVPHAPMTLDKCLQAAARDKRDPTSRPPDRRREAFSGSTRCHRAQPTRCRRSRVGVSSFALRLSERRTVYGGAPGRRGKSVLRTQGKVAKRVTANSFRSLLAATHEAVDDAHLDRSTHSNAPSPEGGHLGKYSISINGRRRTCPNPLRWLGPKPSSGSSPSLCRAVVSQRRAGDRAADDHAEPRPRRGPLNAAIANERIVADFTGRGATKSRAFLHQDVVVCLLEDGATRPRPSSSRPVATSWCAYNVTHCNVSWRRSSSQRRATHPAEGPYVPQRNERQRRVSRGCPWRSARSHARLERRQGFGGVHDLSRPGRETN